jgi:hypothetical protein
MKKKLTDPPGFEPGSEAPEASILSRLYYESNRVFLMIKVVRTSIKRKQSHLNN